MLIEDSPIQCPFLRVKDWKEAWMTLYLRKLKFGQFTEDRSILDHRKYVPFGATEIIMEALKADLLDAAVVVCDGAGTVITQRPEIVQGIGGRMSGLLYTKPRKSVIQRLKKEQAAVLDPETARINPVEGVQRARESYKRVAVTVTASQDIEVLRELSGVAVFVVHTTGVTRTQAEYATKADIVWGCASHNIRETVGPHSLVQLGVGIPVFVLTEKGLTLIVPRISELSPTVGEMLKEKREAILSGTSHLIHHKRNPQFKVELTMRKCTLPVIRQSGPQPLI